MLARDADAHPKVVMLAEHHHAREAARIVTQTIDPCGTCACSPAG